MTDALSRRGPDDRGTWFDEQAGIGLGHRRLAILDLSPRGHQPMLSRSGRFVLVFNGEIYNHRELRERLTGAPSGPDWLGDSDTETLLAGFESWGFEATLEACVGMFAIALWDREKRELWLARDRFGEKPLYYGFQGRSFLFGSELKALTAHPSFERTIDRDAVALFMRHNYVPGPYSVWKGIHKLPPGTWLRVRDADERAGEPTPYWSLAQIAARGTRAPETWNDADATDALERVLSDAVAGQMIADVPLGALLSGGVDSSTIVALMQKQSSRPVKTFSIGFREKKFDESAYAEAVAKHLGTDHCTLHMSAGDVLDVVPRMPEIYDEPFADSSQLPTSLVMALARRHVTVVLSGDAGDELFGGYTRYSLVPKLWSTIAWAPPAWRQTAIDGARALTRRRESVVAKLTRGHVTEDRLDKLEERLRGVRSFDDLYLSLLTEWRGVDDLVLGARPAEDALLHRPSRWPDLEQRVERAMALDALTYLPDDILVKVDRAAMAVSLEARVPLLDHRVAEFAWRLPFHQKRRRGQGKWLLKQVLYRHVPPALIDRPKMGFGVPLDDWLRGPLREWAEDLLAPRRLKQEGLLNEAIVRAAWEAHVSGTRRLGARLWSVLMFQAWLRHHGAG